MTRSVLPWLFALCLLAPSAHASDAPSGPSAALLVATVPAAALLAAVPADASLAAVPIVRAPESRSSGLIASYVAHIALQSYDTYATLGGASRGHVERNPLLTSLVEHPTAFIVVKSAITAATIMAAEQMWREHHPGRAIALMAVSNGLMAVVAANNVSALRR